MIVSMLNKYANRLQVIIMIIVSRNDVS